MKAKKELKIVEENCDWKCQCNDCNCENGVCNGNCSCNDSCNYDCCCGDESNGNSFEDAANQVWMKLFMDECEKEWKRVDSKRIKQAAKETVRDLKKYWDSQKNK